MVLGLNGSRVFCDKGDREKWSVNKQARIKGSSKVQRSSTIRSPPGEPKGKQQHSKEFSNQESTWRTKGSSSSFKEKQCKCSAIRSPPGEQRESNKVQRNFSNQEPAWRTKGSSSSFKEKQCKCSAIRIPPGEQRENNKVQRSSAIKSPPGEQREAVQVLRKSSASVGNQEHTWRTKGSSKVQRSSAIRSPPGEQREASVFKGRQQLGAHLENKGKTTSFEGRQVEYWQSGAYLENKRIHFRINSSQQQKKLAARFRVNSLR
ncbi:uncharacterized protein LOC142181860 [Nicotiana tabacum]|uniref:Uncharacterized protein LOC142181860 n=1 Tax=Nicotiana tabacum TaxID=4097 RepID=A0AC58UQ04_TOBAC